MRPIVSRLDRYLLRNVGGTLASVFAIVISLMLLEHLPRLFDIVRLSGRKVTIIVESLASLLPEYASIGLLFGLYFSLALTVRRLSLRGELDIIEATGVPARRWMRAPMLVATVVAALLLWSQGWLMPNGERRLADLERQMENGTFGYDLESGNFIDLGNGVTLRFERIERTTGELAAVFIKKGDTTFTAARGRLAFDLHGDVLLDLAEGRSIDRQSGQSLAFAHFHIDSGKGAAASGPARSRTEVRKGRPLADLLASRDSGDRAAAWSRLLWPAFALLIPFLAVVMGKPARRSNSALGLTGGAVLLVLFIRSADLVMTLGSLHPQVFAAAVFALWSAVIFALLPGERRWGAGYVDRQLRRLLAGLGRRRARTLPESPPATEARLRPRPRDGRPAIAALPHPASMERRLLTGPGDHRGYGARKPEAALVEGSLARASISIEGRQRPGC